MADQATDIDVRLQTPDDLPMVSALHAATFGPGRFARTAYRVREGDVRVSPHCYVAYKAGELIGAVTMTEIMVGPSSGHWLLGPLAVLASEANKGYGRQLVATALQSVVNSADTLATVILVGDLDYYGRLGFEVVPRDRIRMPGPVDPARLLIWRGPEAGRKVPAGMIRPSSASQADV